MPSGRFSFMKRKVRDAACLDSTWTLPALRRRTGMENQHPRRGKKLRNLLFPMQNLRLRSYSRTRNSLGRPRCDICLLTSTEDEQT